MKNNSPVHLPTSDPPKSPTKPASDTDTAVYAVPQKRRAPPPPISPPNLQKPPPDLGEERLDHMSKMKELKPVMPWLETGYYDQVR